MDHTDTKKSIMLGLILISFIHTIDTERNITHKIQESCYKTERVSCAVVTLELRTAKLF